MYSLKLSGFKLVKCTDIDSAMEACFRKYPKSYFSDWQENMDQTWLFVYNNDKCVGKIFEVI